MDSLKIDMDFLLNYLGDDGRRKSMEEEKMQRWPQIKLDKDMRW